MRVSIYQIVHNYLSVSNRYSFHSSCELVSIYTGIEIHGNKKKVSKIK